MSGSAKATLCEPPYEGKKYYCLISQGRKSAALYNIEDGKHYKTISYTKYLMSVHLGRILERDEQVDHINNDKSDDRIENLQILSFEDNLRKFAREVKKGRFLVEMICPSCGLIFIRERRNTHLLSCRNAINTYCSKKCSYKRILEPKTIILREFKEHEDLI